MLQMHGPNQEPTIVSRVLFMNRKVAAFNILIEVNEIVGEGGHPFNTMSRIFKYNLIVINIVQCI